MATTQFCLTNAGNNLVGPNVSLLSDLDNFVSAFQTDITLSSLQPPNCPATITVPDGATQIKVLDPNTNQCAAVNLLGNDLCTLFNLTFSDVQTNTVSQIIFGDITSSFGVVTDYLIYWYRNGQTTPQYISGKGTVFQPYPFTHPLINSATILAPSGTYTMDIAKIRINGIDFTTLDTPPAGFVKMTASCLPTITVTAFNCSNGNFTPNPQFTQNYTHKFQFDNASVGTPPQSLSATFELSTTTNYFAYRIDASSQWDILKITFYGANYANPIVLENIATGINANANPGGAGGGGMVPSAALKSLPVGAFRKVIRLNMLNRSPSDYLTIEIIPNTNNFQTIWSLYLRCLTTFDCTHCSDQFINQPPKIVASQTTTAIGACGSFNVSTKIQACSSSSINSDIVQFIGVDGSEILETTSTPGFRSINFNGLNANIRACGFSSGGGGAFQCAASPQGTTNISTSVTNGCLTLTYTFTNSANFNTYLNSFVSRLTSLQNTYPNYTNPQNPDFYRFTLLGYPNVSSGCGDGTPSASIQIPIWSTYTTTPNSLSINFCQIPNGSGGAPNYAQDFITANNITNCDTNCATSVNSFVSAINSSITSYSTTPLNLTNSTGAYYFNSVDAQAGGLSYSPPNPIVVTTNGDAGNGVKVYSNVTYLMDTSGVLIDNTPYKVCDFESLGGWRASPNPTYNINNGLGDYYRDFYYFKGEPRIPYNISYPDDFQIYTKAIVNGQLVNSPEIMIYQKFNGVITTNNSYVI